MRCPWIAVLGLVCGITLWAGTTTRADAVNINTDTVECQVSFAPADQIFRTDFGVSTLDTTATGQMIICSAPHTPLPPGSTTGGFYVDGNNYNGASTSCAIFAFDFNGQLTEIASFATSAPQYDNFITLNAAHLTSLSHTTLRCLLPAHGNGRVRGVTWYAPTPTASISSSMIECLPVDGLKTDIRYVENGVYTEGVVATPRTVTCSVPRSPVTSTSSGETYYVTGDNRDGAATTTCTLALYDFNGPFRASASFTTSAAHYIQPLFFTAAQLSVFPYASVTCVLPPQARGDLESVVTAGGGTFINTMANECQAQFWPQDTLVHTDKGVSTASTATADLWTSCSAPRSPLTGTATSGFFYVDGDSRNGATTVCVMASYNYTGDFIQSSGFGSPGPVFSIKLPIELSYWAYTGLTCVLPAHGNGTLRGITALQ